MSKITSESIGRLFNGLTTNRALTSLNLSNNNLRSHGAIRARMRSETISVRNLRRSVKATHASNASISRVTNRAEVYIGDRYGTCEPKNADRARPYTESALRARRVIDWDGAAAQHIPPRAGHQRVQCEIGGFRGLCKDLARNEHIMRLHMAHNTRADGGAASLADAVREHPTLEELCEVSDDGGRLLIASVYRSATTSSTKR
jgi:hypothetical protein